MAKWIKEHLGFKTTKAPPPAPPKPDYRYCPTVGVTGTPGYQQQHQQPGSGATYPSPGQPDILAAYKLQKALDFEDPYTPGGNISFGSSLNTVGSSSDPKYGSPKHRLIKVETIEKSSPVPGVTVTQAVAIGSAKPPSSPPSENDKEKVVDGFNAGGQSLIILEDYADPFDVEQAGGTQTSGVEKVTTENDGYMEPYEAQKMMAGCLPGGEGVGPPFLQGVSLEERGGRSHWRRGAQGVSLEERGGRAQGVSLEERGGRAQGVSLEERGGRAQEERGGRAQGVSLEERGGRAQGVSLEERGGRAQGVSLEERGGRAQGVSLEERGGRAQGVSLEERGGRAQGVSLEERGGRAQGLGVCTLSAVRRDYTVDPCVAGCWALGSGFR
ncbi:hypothetical protein NHX12_006427, partial [Muraenolepis orangiensis]